MNAKQALKKVVQRNADLEDYNRRASADIKAYNECIDTMIAGGSPCPWCMEYDECQLEAKNGKGCSEWWLKEVTPTVAQIAPSVEKVTPKMQEAVENNLVFGSDAVGEDAEE